MPPILPPLPPQPGGLVIFSPNQWAWLGHAFQRVHADQEVIASFFGPLTHSLEGLLMATGNLTQALSDLHDEIASHATKIQTQLQQLIDAQASNDQPAIDAATASIRSEIAALQGLDTNLDADDTAAPTP